MKKRSGVFAAVCIVCTVALFYVFAMTAYGIGAVQSALVICATRLVPALFPAVAVSCYVMKSGMSRLFEKPFGAIVHRIYGLPPSCAAPVLLGLICGFPSGALCAGEAYGRDECTKEQAEYIACMCSIPSPAFVIGYVGTGLMGSTVTGVILYFSVLIASFACAAVLPHHDMQPIIIANCVQGSKPSPFAAIVPSVSQAVMKTLVMCGYVLAFAVVGGAAMLVTGNGKVSGAIVFALLELTQAAVRAAEFPAQFAFVMLAVALGFSGLSVFCQVSACTFENNLSVSKYIPAHLLTAAFSGVIAAAFVLLPPLATAAFVALILFAFLLLPRRRKTGTLRQR